MKQYSKMENAEIFRKVLADYISLCRIPSFIRLNNNELREISCADYSVSLPYKEVKTKGFILYVEMKTKAFYLLNDCFRRVEKENNVPIHVRCSDSGIMMLDGYANDFFVQYVIFNEGNL